MKKEKAIEIILKKPNNRVLYARLTKWDERKTADENSVLCGLPKASKNFVYLFARKYSLDFYKSRMRGSWVTEKFKQKKAQIIDKWNEDLTVQENATKIGIPLDGARCYARNYNLSFVKRYKNGIAVKVKAHNRLENLREQFTALRNKGLTLDVIAKTYGITRERVRQVLI